MSLHPDRSASGRIGSGAILGQLARALGWRGMLLVGVTLTALLAILLAALGLFILLLPAILVAGLLARLLWPRPTPPARRAPFGPASRGAPVIEGRFEILEEPGAGPDAGHEAERSQGRDWRRS